MTETRYSERICNTCGMWMSIGEPHTCIRPWKCDKCGMWITPEPNIYHDCTREPLPDRVATALEAGNKELARIADALEKIAMEAK